MRRNSPTQKERKGTQLEREGKADSVIRKEKEMRTQLEREGKADSVIRKEKEEKMERKDSTWKRIRKTS